MEAARMQPQHPARRDRGGLLEEITRSVVGLHKEYIGQGPTRARTYICDDLVVCVLQGGFSRAERTLLEHGRTGAVVHHMIPVVRDRHVMLDEGPERRPKATRGRAGATRRHARSARVGERTPPC